MRLLLVLPILFFSLFSYSLTLGESLKEFSLKDQHDVETKVDNSVKYLLFAKDKKASKFVAEAFKETDKEYFSTKKLVYLADVSGMPGFVFSWFALPKMKKYPFQVLIDDKPELTKNLPTKKDQVSLIYLENLKVIKIEYFEDAKSLKAKVEELN